MTEILKDYMIRGFVLDDERLKRGMDPLDEDYFKDSLERIDSIRSSDRRIWQKITDIFAECTIDYDRSSPTAREFYSMVADRFCFAIAGLIAGGRRSVPPMMHLTVRPRSGMTLPAGLSAAPM